MVCSFFASLSLFFSEVNTRSDTSEVRKSKEPVRPPSTLSPSYKALVSFVYLGRQVTQFCRNVLLSNSAVLERYRPEARIPAWIRPDTITAAIVTPCHDRELLRLRDFAPITRDENMSLVKRAIISRRYPPVRWWSIISGIENVIKKTD